MNDYHEGMEMGYGRFAAMITPSTIIMFGLMYLNARELDHAKFSQTRMWKAIMAGGHHFMRTPIGDAPVVYALPKR